MNFDALTKTLNQASTPTLIILFLVFSACIFANIRYYLTLQRAMSAVSPSLRPFHPALIWLALLPFVGVLWYMVYVVMLSLSLRKELARRALPGDGAIGIAVTTVIMLGLCLAPSIGLFFMLPALVMWVMHWMRMAVYGKLLSEPIYMLVD